ncbi:MAG TPA: hypothetical protein VI321_08750, partial [Burkholderiales bacterium]
GRAPRADQARPDDPLPPLLVVVHLIDGTYELFRHFYGLRRFNKGNDKPYDHDHEAGFEQHAREYLAWEVALLEQIKRDPTIRFF